jgi:hypothetical protein
MPPWDFLAPFVAPFAMALPPLFDDGRNCPSRRLRVMAIVALAFAFMWALIDANGSTIPSIGHLAGIVGILEFYGPQVFFSAVWYAILGFPFFFCYDRVASSLWSVTRRFSDEPPN